MEIIKIAIGRTTCKRSIRNDGVIWWFFQLTGDFFIMRQLEEWGSPEFCQSGLKSR
jgi:hypothetical protein